MKKYLLLFLCAFTYGSIYGQTSFTSVTDGDWENCATWGTCPGVVPGTNWPATGDRATIAQATIVTVAVNQTCSLLTVDGDDSFNSGLTVNSGVVLTVENEWQVDSKTDDGELTITIIGTVNVADDLDVNITHSGFTATIDIRSTGAVNLNDPSVTNTIFVTGSGAELSMLCHGPLTIADRMVMRVTNGASCNIDADGDITMTNDDLQLETQGASSTLTIDLDATLTCPDRLILKSDAASTSASVTINMVSGGTVNLDGLLDLLGAGGGGTIDASSTASTFEYGGAGIQTIELGTPIEYHNLVLSGAGTKTLGAAVSTANVQGSITVATGTLDNGGFAIAGNPSKTFQVDADATFELSGTTSTFPTAFGTFTLASASTVVYEGSGAQAISDQSYGHLTLSTSGDKSLSSTLTASGNVTIGTNVTLNANSNALNIEGDWSNSGTFTQGTSKVTMNGSSDQTIGGTTTTTFFNMEIDNSATKVSLDVNANLEGALTLKNGEFTTTGQIFTLLSTASGTAQIAAITGGTIFGDITMQRFVPSGNTGWHMLGIPVSSTDVNDWDEDTDFVLSLDDGDDGIACCPNFYSVHRYNNSTEIYTALQSVTDGLSAQDGYFVYTGTSQSTTIAFTYDVTGAANTGTQEFTLVNTSDNFNMISNPFPSAIDGDLQNGTAWPVKNNMHDEVHVWDPDIGTPGYQTYISGMASPDAGWDGHIAAHQAFWVFSDGGAPELSLAEAGKVSTESNAFWKTGQPEISLFRLAITEAASSVYLDEAVMAFRPGATYGEDPAYDAHQMIPYVPHSTIASIVNDTIDLVINAVPELDSSISIPLRVLVTSTGSYTISLKGMDLIAESSCLVLEDKFTNTFTNLKNDSSYTFAIADTTYSPRFFMHIGAPITKGRSNLLCQGDSDGMAIAGGQGAGPWSYVWTNSNGDTVKVSANVSSADTLSGVNAGTYNVYVTGAGGLCGTVMDTIIITEPTAITAATQVVNTTCFGDNDGGVDLTITGGTPPYAYAWSNGANTQDLSSLTPGNYDVNITDDNGCLTSVNLTVTETADLLIFSAANDITCNGDNDGAIDLSVTGGTPPYAYAWSNSESTEDMGGLAPGTYSVQVTDNNNCVAADSFEITEPIVVVSTFVAEKDTAYLSEGGDIQFTNTSFGASSFEWDFDDGSPINTAVSPLHIFDAVGAYEVTMVASNANNCSDTSYKSTVVM
ncbi:MAG TPA: PKD domain-containing protein, partial [Flavobacteriales bacterium]|nr:PKD domain-containing protein [Flavobacteriales bacterium]